MNDVTTKPYYPHYDILNCPDDIKCPIAYYKCREVNYCIPIEKVCDEIYHCSLKDDEIFCSGHSLFRFFYSTKKNII